MTTLDQLVEPMTVDEAKAAVYAALEARGVKTTSWKPGAVVRSIIVGASIIYAAFSRLQALVGRQGFLDLSEGDWLTLVALYVYDVIRISGTFATGIVRLDNAGGGVYAGGVGSLIVASSVNGKSYRNTEPYSIGAGQMGVLVHVEAIEIGSDSSAAAGDIDTLVTALSGVSVTNENALIGTDEELDVPLRQRCRDKLGTLSPNGPADAYNYFARSAVREDGTSIGVTRTLVIPDGYGNVTLYVATPSGPVDGDPDDPSTDLGAIFKAIEENVLPLGITLILQSASAVDVDVTYEIWIKDSTTLSNTQVIAAIADHIGTFLGNYPIGGEIIDSNPGRLYVDSLAAAIANALPIGAVVKLVITVPSADVDLAPNEVPIAGAVTPTAVHRVAEGL